MQIWILYVLCALVFNLFQAYFAQGDVVCPSGSRKAGQTCFKYHTSQAMSWSNARKECKKTAGSDLVIIRNQDLFNFIRDAINKYGYKFWVGASDSVTETNFKWVDGSSCCFPFWIPGEPNNYKGRNEDCVNFWSVDGNTGLNDEVCWEESGFVCELKDSKQRFGYLTNTWLVSLQNLTYSFLIVNKTV